MLAGPGRACVCGLTWQLSADRLARLASLSAPPGSCAVVIVHALSCKVIAILLSSRACRIRALISLPELFV